MKYALTLLLALTAIALAPSVRAQDTETIKTKLKQIEEDWAKAAMDKDHGAAVMATTLADDYAGVNSQGKIQSKADYVAETKSSTDTMSSAANSEMEVHIYAPNLATVTGMYIEKGKNKSGKSFSHTYGWVDTFMERNGKWECIAEGATLSKK